MLSHFQVPARTGNPILIPTGAIIPTFAGYGVTGWSVYTAMEGYYPLGWSPGQDIGNKGSSGVIACTDVNDPDHVGTHHAYDKDDGGIGSNWAGAHGHTWTFADPQPYHYRMFMWKATAPTYTIPQWGGALKHEEGGGGGGLLKLNTGGGELGGALLRNAATIGFGDGRTEIITAGTAGLHAHGNYDGGNNNDNNDSYRVVSSYGSHNHTRSVTLTFRAYRRCLSLWYSDAAGFWTPSGKLIIMYESESPPSGDWLYCDGTNGTPAMGSRYIFTQTEDAAAGTAYGDYQVTGVGGTSSSDGSHRHYESSHSGDKSSNSDYHYDYQNAHTHVVGVNQQNYWPPYYRIGFYMANF